MYRKMDSIQQRAQQIAQIAFQLDVLERIVEGPYAAGAEPTAADAALFPTVVFMDFMLPTYFGWKDLFQDRPNLRRWWQAIKADPDAVKVRAVTGRRCAASGSMGM